MQLLSVCSALMEPGLLNARGGVVSACSETAPGTKMMLQSSHVSFHDATVLAEPRIRRPSMTCDRSRRGECNGDACKFRVKHHKLAHSCPAVLAAQRRLGDGCLKLMMSTSRHARHCVVTSGQGAVVARTDQLM
jgi:hypothetical protein